MKAAGDSLRPLGFAGEKQEFYRFTNRLRLAVCFFAHGHLTANPYRLPAQNVVVIGCSLHAFLLDFMRTTLLRRVQIAEALHPRVSQTGP